MNADTSDCYTPDHFQQFSCRGCASVGEWIASASSSFSNCARFHELGREIDHGVEFPAKFSAHQATTDHEIVSHSVLLGFAAQPTSQMPEQMRAKMKRKKEYPTPRRQRSVQAIAEEFWRSQRPTRQSSSPASQATAAIPHPQALMDKRSSQQEHYHAVIHAAPFATLRKASIKRGSRLGSQAPRNFWLSISQ